MSKQTWIITLCLVVSTFVSAKSVLQVSSSNIVEQHYSEYLRAFEQGLTTLGVSYNHQILPGNRLNSNMNNDQADIITLMAKSSINNGNAFIIEPEVTQGYIYFYYHKATDLNNLAGQTLSLIAGIEYHQEFSNIYQLNEVFVNDVDVALRMVNAKRTAGTLFSTAAQADLENYPNVKMLAQPVAIETFHIAISKRHSELVGPITDLIIQMKEAETFNYRRLDGSILYQDLPN